MPDSIADQLPDSVPDSTPDSGLAPAAAASHDPQQRDAMLLLADVYLEQGQYDKARTLLDALALLWPDDSGVLKALAFACLQGGRFDEALAAADGYLRLGPATRVTAPILLIRGRALWGLGRVDEARDGLQRYFDLLASA